MERTTNRYRIQKADVVIGVDPDIEKSGVSIIDAKSKEIQFFSLTFPEVIETCSNVHKECEASGKRLKIIVEGGWLNKGNWHLTARDNYRIAARKGHDAGLNHGAGMKLVECMEFNKFPVTVIRPLKKFWNGKDGKITNDELNGLLRQYGFSEIKRSNQDQRDSVLLGLLNI